MLRRLMVPLDGSNLAETALPLARSIARSQAAEVVLVRVVRPPTWATDDGGDYAWRAFEDLKAALDAEARRYLDELAGESRAVGVPTRAFVRHGRPADELLYLELELHPDLMVMATHGRTGLARLALGSVADRMVREGDSPVLIARALGRPSFGVESALVPLDGSSLAEEALPLVEELAGRPLKRVGLIRAIHSAEEEPAAARYLAEIEDGLAPTGLILTRAVYVGDPVDVIEREAPAVDLVIMATHGRGGFDRLRHGSVATHVSRHASTPVLLVRAGMAITTRPKAEETVVAAAR